MSTPSPEALEYAKRVNERDGRPRTNHKETPMKLKDETGWAKARAANTDPYGNACMTFAERWADLMEAEMSTGAKLTDIATDTSGRADTEGITGFMYGAAVSTLAQVWEHGDELRRWHTLAIQIKDEGERANESGATLNPALISLG